MGYLLWPQSPIDTLPLSFRGCMNHGVVTMMTSSNGKKFPPNWPFVRGIHRSRWIPTQRPVTWSFDVFFDLRLNKRLSKQWWGWWFETPSCPLWRHSNDGVYYKGTGQYYTPVACLSSETENQWKKCRFLENFAPTDSLHILVGFAWIRSWQILKIPTFSSSRCWMPLGLLWFCHVKWKGLC